MRARPEASSRVRTGVDVRAARRHPGSVPLGMDAKRSYRWARALALLVVLCGVPGARGLRRAPQMKLKGFGGVGSASSGGKGSKSKAKAGKAKLPKAKVDRSARTRAFYDLMESRGCDFDAVAIATFDVGFDLRGVVAMKDIKKGQKILSLPAEAAVDLGSDSRDPTGPALALLRVIRESSGGSELQKYLDLLPAPDSGDCATAPDFWEDAWLDKLGWAGIAEETRARRGRVLSRFEEQAEADGFSLEEVKWATWIVSSRVLTVQAEAPAPARKLLIPFIDMCNHDRSSPHLLSGRASPGGRLNIIAGRDVSAGEQIVIKYGVDETGNDRFCQDYGFLDEVPAAYDAALASCAEEQLAAAAKLEPLDDAGAEGVPPPVVSVINQFRRGMRGAADRAAAQA